MKCPVCGMEMQKGGLIAMGRGLVWVPEEKFEKGWRPAYDTEVSLGKTSHLLGETRVPDAYYCESCRKVTGIFDVTDRD